MLREFDEFTDQADQLEFPKDDRDHTFSKAFRAFVGDPDFPCVGAKAALKKGDLNIIVAHDIFSNWDDQRIYTALLGFIARYKRRPDLFQSFIVIFNEDNVPGEISFEKGLWARIQSLSQKDVNLNHRWDKRVKADPSDPHFSLSFANEAFFIVGLHPRASRPARRFERPVLVFNLHDQFERLRDEGRYEKLRDSIVERDISLAGSINPMLSRHGEVSEARQYSGREVTADWTCPFQPPEKSIDK